MNGRVEQARHDCLILIQKPDELAIENGLYEIVNTATGSA